jgi:ABC-type Mn2+/Zn2+ transport system ATPase subunit
VAVPPALELRGVTAGYGGVPVVRDVSLRLGAGELAGLVGPSGVGKTTVLRLLTGQCERHGGSVRVAGEALRPGRPAPRLGYVPQVGSVAWDFPLTVEQVVLLGLAGESRRVPWHSRRERGAAAAMLERLGLDGLRRRPIAELSGGQQQRMFLARALVRDADLILLDEPTSGVDLATRREVLALLAELHREGLTILLTTHDLNWVAAHLPRVVCFNETVIADGPPRLALTTEALALTYGAEVRILHDGDRVVVVDPQPDRGPDPDQLPAEGAAPATVRVPSALP